MSNYEHLIAPASILGSVGATLAYGAYVFGSLKLKIQQNEDDIKDLKSDITGTIKATLSSEAEIKTKLAVISIDMKHMNEKISKIERGMNGFLRGKHES